MPLHLSKILNMVLNVWLLKATTGHLRYLEIKGNGETTSSFPKFEISKLRPAKVHKKSQLFQWFSFHFHYVNPVDCDFKRIFPDLTHDVKTSFNNSCDERLLVDIKSAKTDF